FHHGRRHILCASALRDTAYAQCPSMFPLEPDHRPSSRSASRPRRSGARRLTFSALPAEGGKRVNAKRTILSALIVVCTIGASATTASAGQPVGGCSDSFKLARASKFPDQTI